MYELLTGASPFTVDGEKNSQSQISKYVGFSFIALIIEIIFVNFYIKIDSFLSCSIHLYLICSLIVVQTSAYDTKIYKICRVIFCLGEECFQAYTLKLFQDYSCVIL